jgi:hypothetical protein
MPATDQLQRCNITEPISEVHSFCSSLAHGCKQVYNHLADPLHGGITGLWM